MSEFTPRQQDWADRLNRATGRADYDAAYIARTERRAGKPYGEITLEDFALISDRGDDE